MNDYIDRQAAIDAILHNQEVYSNNFGNDPIDRYTIAIIDNDAQTIVQLPSVEAEPVKHGRWKEKTINHCRIDEWQSARCSVCGRYHTTPYMYYFTDFKYCPNCGKPMDLKEEAETKNEP